MKKKPTTLYSVYGTLSGGVKLRVVKTFADGRTIEPHYSYQEVVGTDPDATVQKWREYTQRKAHEVLAQAQRNLQLASDYLTLAKLPVKSVP